MGLNDVKDRFRSALAPPGTSANRRSPATTTSSSSSSSSSSGFSKIPSKASTTATATTSSSSSSSSSLPRLNNNNVPARGSRSRSRGGISHFFRRRGAVSAAMDAEAWVDPPLKYSDPPQREYVDLLASWDWDHAAARAERRRWRRGAGGGGREDNEDVSPGTSRRGSWV